MRLPSCVLLVILSACGDDGGGTPTMQKDAPPAASDAPPAACTTANACPCFSNDDCPDGTRCHAADPDHVYCEPGARGSGAAGAPCTGELDCASALCVDGSDTMRCSKTCAHDTDCPAELPTCLGGLGICARAN